MDNFFHWGIGLILWLQQFSPLLDMPFKAITQLGEETTIIMLFAVM